MYYTCGADAHEKALTAFKKVYRHYSVNIHKTLLRQALLLPCDVTEINVNVFTDTFLIPAHQLSSLFHLF